MRRTIRTLLLTGVTAAATMHAQTPRAARHEVDLAFSYQAQRSNTTAGHNFWLQGGGAELSAGIYRGLGFAMNLSGGTTKNIQNTGVDLSTFTATFGPRYTWHSDRGRVAVFGQCLIGEAHGFNSVFPSPQGATATFDTFALQVGGGIDLRVAKHFAVRPLQADWVRTQFPNSTTGVQNNLRLGAGVVLRIR